MSNLVQVRKKFQIDLPESALKELGIQEGDFLEVQVRNGEVVLRIKEIADKNQTWFWTERWQQGEKAAEDDIRAGRLQRFSDSKEAVSFIKKQSPKKSVKSNKDRR
jgi:AbrB family looped-hinge helix DNA binding protein